jgi:hypothetical protein
MICERCKDVTGEKHHVFPQSVYGENDSVVFLCWHCHREWHFMNNYYFIEFEKWVKSEYFPKRDSSSRSELVKTGLRRSRLVGGRDKKLTFKDVELVKELVKKAMASKFGWIDLFSCQYVTRRTTSGSGFDTLPH